MKKGGLIIIVVLILIFPSIVSANNFGFPSAANGESTWPISLHLGESWQMNKGKWMLGHLGIDMVNREKTNIYNASNGIIEKVLRWPKCSGVKRVCNENGCRNQKENNHGWGPTVIIKHEYAPGFITEDTYLAASPAEDNPIVVYTQYGHLDSVDHLEDGQEINKGEYLGQIGKICQWIPHLHFEVKDQAAVDYDEAYSSGAGFGYSGTDGYALNRYIPEEFIAANSHFEEITEEENVIEEVSVVKSEEAKKKKSMFARIKDFFASIFSIESDFSVGNEQTDTTNSAAEQSTENSDTPEKVVEELYNAELLPVQNIDISATDREILITVQAKNTGNQIWKQSEVSLNVVGGRAKNAEYRHSSWLTDLRPTRLDQNAVQPGNIGTFTTLIRIPEGRNDMVFTTQLVRQAGNQFFQLGDGFSSVRIVVEALDDTEVVELEDTSIQKEKKKIKTSIREQIQTIVDSVTRSAIDVIDDIEKVAEKTKNFIFSGGSSSSKSNSDESEEYVLDTSFAVATSSPYLVATSSVRITGTIGMDVAAVAASSTVGGEMNFSTTSRTWQWIGTVEPASTTIGFLITGTDASTRASSFAIYYSPKYTLSAPIFLNIASSTVLYTNSSSTLIEGIADDRASEMGILFSSSSVSVPVTSSTWQYSTSSSLASTTYQFIARDTFENRSPTTTLTVVLDAEAPQITTSTVALTSSTLAIGIVATDTVSGIAEYEVEIRSAQSGDIDTCTSTSSSVAYADMVATSTCEWGGEMSSTASTEIVLPGVLRQQDVIIRFRATDRAQNMSDWEYGYIPYETEAALNPAGDIIFSQIAWMGTEANDDHEWFELYNRSDSDISMVDWKIVWGTYTSSTDSYEYELDFSLPPLPQDEFPPDMEDIDTSGLMVAPAGDFLLFERDTPSVVSNMLSALLYHGAFPDSGTQLLLLDNTGARIDSVHMNSGWSAGDDVSKASMVRIDETISGDDRNNWCTFTDCPVDSFADPDIEAYDANENRIVGSPRMLLFHSPNPVTPQL